MGQRGRVSGRSGRSGLSTEARANGGWSEVDGSGAGGGHHDVRNTRNGICTVGVRPARTCRCTATRSCACIRRREGVHAGLQFVDGASTKAPARSDSRRSARSSSPPARCCRERDVPAPHFGEGITVWKNDLIELTCKPMSPSSTTAPPSTKKQFSYPGEGWGLTQDAPVWIMSDGSTSCASWIR